MEQVRLSNTLVPAGSHVICGRCTLPVGSFVDAAGSIRAVTRCGCDRLPPFTEEPLPEQQPIMAWERRQTACNAHRLCRVCAGAWLPFQARYSPYICRSCHTAAGQVNALLGRSVITRGAHSMNNIVRGPPEGPVAPDVEQAAAILSGAAERPFETDHIREHLALARFNGRAELIHLSLEIDRILGAIRGSYGSQSIRVPDGQDMALLDYLLAAPAVTEGSGPALIRFAQVIATVHDLDAMRRDN